MPTPIAAAGRVGALRPPESGKEKFGQVLNGHGAGKTSAPPSPEPRPIQLASVEQGPLTAAAGKSSAVAVRSSVKRAAVPARAGRVAPAGPCVSAGAAPKTAQVLDQVRQAQARLEQAIQAAQSGRTFTPAELLALQARVSQASQELDLAGKVVDKGTSGVKQLLSTQI